MPCFYPEQWRRGTLLPPTLSPRCRRSLGLLLGGSRKRKRGVASTRKLASECPPSLYLLHFCFSLLVDIRDVRGRQTTQSSASLGSVGVTRCRGTPRCSSFYSRRWGTTIELVTRKSFIHLSCSPPSLDSISKSFLKLLAAGCRLPTLQDGGCRFSEALRNLIKERLRFRCSLNVL